MRYRCLVLDHDDTVVMSSPEIHYPSFLEAMCVLRPERANMTFDEFIRYSCEPGILPLFTEVLRLNEREMALEQDIWRQYTAARVPDAYEGFAGLFARFRARGGHVCVVSHSERDVIERHYRALFGFAPELVFGWELPVEKRKPGPYPLEEIMRRLQLSPADLLMVDDLTPGMDMAAACGVDSAYAGWSHTAPAVGERVRPRARYAFDSVRGLEEFLEIG